MIEVSNLVTNALWKSDYVFAFNSVEYIVFLLCIIAPFTQVWADPCACSASNQIETIIQWERGGTWSYWWTCRHSQAAWHQVRAAEIQTLSIGWFPFTARRIWGAGAFLLPTASLDRIECVNRWSNLRVGCLLLWFEDPLWICWWITARNSEFSGTIE